MPDSPGSFLTNEPVLATSAAGAIVAWLAGFLVTHGVITDTTASSVTQQVVPILAGVLVLAMGAVTRRLVSPAKKVESILASAGLMSDADFGRLEALLEDKFGGLLHPEPQTGEAQHSPG